MEVIWIPQNTLYVAVFDLFDVSTYSIAQGSFSQKPLYQLQLFGGESDPRLVIRFTVQFVLSTRKYIIFTDSVI